MNIGSYPKPPAPTGDATTQPSTAPKKWPITTPAFATAETGYLRRWVPRVDYPCQFTCEKLPIFLIIGIGTSVTR